MKELIGAEVLQRQGVASDLNDSLRSLRRELDALGRGLRAEVSTRRDTTEKLCRRLAATEERSTQALHEQCKEPEIYSGTFEAERSERPRSAERCEGQIVDLRSALDNGRASNTATWDDLEKEVVRLRKALEDEARQRISADHDLTISLETQEQKCAAIEASLHQEANHMSICFEQEAKARASGDMQNERSLETALGPLQSSLDELSKRFKDQVFEEMRCCNETQQRELKERATVIDSLIKML